MTFAWDPQKADENLKKHGVDFREAATVFDDTLSMTFPDEGHSVGERGFLIIGRSFLGRTLVVSHTEVATDTIRIISARSATRFERTFYEEGNSNPN
ncbi:MAG: BrnT family toxin [Vicinamibacterales bacterium]